MEKNKKMAGKQEKKRGTKNNTVYVSAKSRSFSSFVRTKLFLFILFYFNQSYHNKRLKATHSFQNRTNDTNGTIKKIYLTSGNPHKT